MRDNTPSKPTPPYVHPKVTFYAPQFNAIAAIIRLFPAEGARRVIARIFADNLEKTNNNFKRDKFLRACGLTNV